MAEIDFFPSVNDTPAQDAGVVSGEIDFFPQATQPQQPLEVETPEVETPDFFPSVGKEESGGILPDFDLVAEMGLNALAETFVESPIEILSDRVLTQLAAEPVTQDVEPLPEVQQQAALDTITSPLFPAAAGIAEALRLANKASKGALEKFVEEVREASRERVKEREQEIGEKLQEANLATDLVGSAVSSVVATTPGLAAGFVNPLAGLAIIGLSAAGAEEARALRQGHNQRDARLHGMISGLVEAGTEAVPFKTLFSRGPFRKKLIKFLLSEEAGELTAETLGYLSDVAVLGEEFNAEELKTRLWKTAAVTPIAAGIQVGGVNTVQRAADVKQRWEVIKETKAREGVQGKIAEERLKLIDELVAELQQAGEMGEGEVLVWHGTPARISKDQGFDSKYIVSEWYDDERGDAWGFYFSDSPKYAEGYRGIEGIELKPTGIGEELSEIGYDALAQAAIEAQDVSKTPVELRENTAKNLGQKIAQLENELIQAETPEQQDQIRRDIVNLQTVMRDPSLIPFDIKPGNLYSVAITDTDSFFNWGKRLENQEGPVRELLEDAGMKPGETGQEFYRRIQKEHDWNAKQTSEYLADLGIEGVVYDRHFADGPHKVYTVFTEANPTVVELNTARAEKLGAELQNFEFKKAVRELAEKPPELSMQDKVKTLFQAVNMSREEMYKQMDENLNFDIAKRWLMGLEQLADANPGEIGLQNYRSLARLWNEKQGEWVSRANALVQEWDRMLGDGPGGLLQNSKLERQIDDLVQKVGEVSQIRQQRLTRGEVEKLARGLKLDLIQDQHLDLLEQMWDDYRDAIDDAVKGIESVVSWRTEDEVLREQALKPIREQAAKLKNQNFVPKFRFGKERILVRAGGKTGEVIYEKHYETRKEAEKDIPRLRKLYPGGHIQLDVDPRSIAGRRHGGFEGINDSFIEALAEELPLSDTDLFLVEEIKERYRPEARFLNAFETRDEKPGWSTNALRNYATFMNQFAHRNAKLHYNHLMDRAIRQVAETQIQGLEDPNLGDSIKRKRTQLAEWLKTHRDYMANPTTEWTPLRAFGFMWYLGFVPKAAAVNLTQVPLVTYPYLASQYGDATAVAAIAKAQKRFFENFRRPDALSDGEREMLDILKRTVLEENQAQELGAVSQGDALQQLTHGRLVTNRASRRAMRKTMEAGAFMFQKAENFNRYITAMAAYDLAIKNGKTQGQAINAAREAVIRTQFEYARYNRPWLMRGRRSALFLFMQYLTSMMWLLGGAASPLAWRMLAMMLFTGGVLGGIPGAENILDLVDGMLTKVKEKTGWKDPKTQVREELREFIEGLVAEPDTLLGDAAHAIGLKPEEVANYILRGVGAGIDPTLGISQLLGGPDLPDVDISGSLSFGRILPGTETVAREGNVERVISEGLRGAAGALGNIPYGVMQAAYSNEMDGWKNWERAMPTQMRNMSRAIRWAVNGGETDTRLRQLMRLDYDQAADYSVTALQGMGFAPTELRIKQERTYAANDAVAYYQGRRSALMAYYYKALRGRADRKAANLAIRKYNNSVRDSFPELMIGPKDLKASMRDRMKDSVFREKGFRTEKRYRRLYTERLGPFGEPFEPGVNAPETP